MDFALEPGPAAIEHERMPEMPGRGPSRRLWGPAQNQRERRRLSAREGA